MISAADPLRSFDAPARTARRIFLCAVVVAHACGLGALTRCQSTPAAPERRVLPFDVAIVDEAPAVTPPEPPSLPAPKAALAPHAPQVPWPEIVIEPPTPQPAVATARPPTPPLPVATTVVAAATAVPAPAASASPPAPPAAPKRVPRDSVRYAIRPPEDFPPLSRRLNETGKVLLRVVFDANGDPRVVALARTSGFTRLDEQALSSMRKARIHPCKENGVAIECELTATMVYELED